MRTFEMPERRPEDGTIGVERDGDTLILSATTNGITSSLQASEYNVVRLFGLLSVMLGIPLPKKIMESIKL